MRFDKELLQYLLKGTCDVLCNVGTKMYVCVCVCTMHRQLFPAVLVAGDDTRQMELESRQVDGRQRKVHLPIITVPMATTTVSLDRLHGNGATSC